MPVLFEPHKEEVLPSPKKPHADLSAGVFLFFLTQNNEWPSNPHKPTFLYFSMRKKVNLSINRNSRLVTRASTRCPYVCPVKLGQVKL